MAHLEQVLTDLAQGEYQIPSGRAVLQPSLIAPASQSGTVTAK
jgi:hypothetical protein